jgi:hypothetical protein
LLSFSFSDEDNAASPEGIGSILAEGVFCKGKSSFCSSYFLLALGWYLILWSIFGVKLYEAIVDKQRVHDPSGLLSAQSVGGCWRRMIIPVREGSGGRRNGGVSLQI